MECEVFLQLSVMARRTRSTRRRRSRRGGTVTIDTLKAEAKKATGVDQRVFDRPDGVGEGIDPSLDGIADVDLGFIPGVDPEPEPGIQRQPGVRKGLYANERRSAMEDAALVAQIDKVIPGYASTPAEERNAMYTEWDKTATDEEREELDHVLRPKKPKYTFGPDAPQPVRSGRRTRRRRGGAMSDGDKRALVDDILAAIANAPPDKLQLLKDAVSPIEPPALKVEVADAAKEETPEDGVAKIIALLMKLDDTKLMELKTALETAPMKGGVLTPEEDEAVLRRREERIAASKARIAAANQPLSAKVKAAGKTARELLMGILIVLGSAASNGGRTRRRRRGSRRA